MAAAAEKMAAPTKASFHSHPVRQEMQCAEGKRETSVSANGWREMWVGGLKAPPCHTAAYFFIYFFLDLEQPCGTAGPAVITELA